MTQVIVNLGTGGADLNGRSGSTTGADSNDPKFLPWEGENYVYLPGVAGNYLSVPDEAALDITGDIDIRAYVALDDWTPSGTHIICSKFDTVGNQRSWMLYVDSSTGYLGFQWSTDGSVAATTFQTSTIASTVADGSALWVRATLDVDNGASGYDVKFYTSDDGSTWTQLGSTVTGGSTTSIFSGTADVVISGRNDGTLAVLSGKVYRAEVWDGIEGSGGTKVLDVDTSLVASGSDTSFTALTGQTVTINRSTSGRKSVSVTHPVWLFGTDDYMEVADNALLDFGASDSFTALVVVREWNNTVTGVSLSKKDGFGTTGAWQLIAGSSGNYVLDAGDGSVRLLPAEERAANGALSVAAGVRNVTADQFVIYVNATSGTPVTDTTTAAISSSTPLRVGRNAGSGAAEYNNMEFIAAAVFRRALTASEIAAITTYFQNRVA